MTVVEGWFAGTSYKGKVPDMLDLPEAVRPHLELNIAMNSKVIHLCEGLCSCPIQNRSVATFWVLDVVSHALGH